MSTRLPGTKYKRVFDRGRSLKGRLLVAWYYQGEDADQLAGVVVSKKTFHDSVDRNRAKRLIREAYRLMVAKGEMPKNTEWIFIGRKSLENKRVQDVEADITAISKRLSGDDIAMVR